MYKSNVGDFPLKVHPCKYWWVRYAVSCTYFSDRQRELLEAYTKHINLPQWSSCMGSYEKRRIWVSDDDHESEYELDKQSEEYKKLNDFLRKYNDFDSSGDQVGWVDCPFENEDQSACPFYEVEDFYKDIPLEELRQRKGHDV